MKNKLEKNILISEKKIYLGNKLNIKKKINKNILGYILFLIFIFVLLIAILYYSMKIIRKKISLKKDEITYSDNNNINFNNVVYIKDLEAKDLIIFQSLEPKIEGFIEESKDEQLFFFGLLRKIKPKKIVEIGLAHGGSSSLILTAIKDIKGAKLYSIDKLKLCYRNRNKSTGYLVQERFPELMSKWTLFLGGITAEFIETIGDGIDLVFIDTMHVTPGEMLDFLMVLPFLKNEAIIVLHDVFTMYNGRTINKKKYHTSNNLLLCYIRGNLILPNYGDKVFFRNIGAIKLSPEQKFYYYLYFLALGIQWEYMPNERDLKIMRDFFMKYYGEKYIQVFDDAVEKNKIFLSK